jgi:hypothetical protein
MLAKGSEKGSEVEATRNNEQGTWSHVVEGDGPAYNAGAKGMGGQLRASEDTCTPNSSTRSRKGFNLDFDSDISTIYIMF